MADPASQAAPARPPVVCVTGATGFIGSYLLPALVRAGVEVRALSRSGALSVPGVSVYLGDISEPDQLRAFLRGADVLVNLAHPAESVDSAQFEQGLRNIAEAVVAERVRRVVQMSTAMVVGVPDSDRVTEDSPLHPRTEYERRKHRAETVLQGLSAHGVDVGVLRPTAVFGPSGLNLIKLMDTVAHGGMWKRRLLRFLHGCRRLHLVSVRDVEAASVFLTLLPRPLQGEVFLVTADDHPDNQYQAVETLMAQALDRPVLRSTWALPAPVLRWLLSCVGRSQACPTLVYDGRKLRQWGFHPPADFLAELRALATWYKSREVR